jgi:multidrug efflux pump subunit AcrA (membrane-fusion protein)
LTRHAKFSAFECRPGKNRRPFHPLQKEGVGEQAVARSRHGRCSPLGALVRDRGEWAVYRVDQGRARLRRIRAGALTDRDAEILSGLDPGDKVIVYPSDQVQDGLRVHLTMTQPLSSGSTLPTGMK